MRKIWLAIFEDQHTDPKIIAFEDRNRAIAQGKRWVEGYEGPDDPEDETVADEYDWPYSIRLSEEGDYVTVRGINLVTSNQLNPG
jgi:hypothetical protein